MTIEEIAKNSTILISKRNVGYVIRCFFDVYSSETSVADLNSNLTETISNLQKEILTENF